MSQKLPVNGFEWVKVISSLNKKPQLIKNYDEDRDKRYILKVDVEYPKDLHDLHNDLPFLPERMRIEKCNKLVFNLYDKKTSFKKNVIHTRALKQALNHRLILKKVHRVIQFNEKAWLKVKKILKKIFLN